MAPKTLLVDGNSLIHRAYHAIPHLSTTAGQPTNAAFGFVQMLLALLDAERPAVAILALDPPGRTFRHDLDEQYKAQRAPMEEELVSQLGMIRELAEALGLAIVEVAGYEADDVIGTLARLAEQRGDDVLVVSGDRDLLQLVSPHVHVLATIKGIKQTRTYDAAAVHEEFGVAPAAVVELKGLAGDTSDNIPGVPQVGPKTARDLIVRFGSIDELYRRLAEVDSPTLRSRLAEHEAAARLSRRLAEIHRDAPVDEASLAVAWRGPDAQRLRRLLAELEFTSLLNRIPVPDAGTGASDLPPAAAPALGDDLGTATGDAVGLAVVVEHERAVGLAIATAESPGGYLALPAGTGQTGLFAEVGDAAVPDHVRTALEDPAVPKVGHDLKRAAHALQAAGIALAGFAFDTAVAAYLLAPHRADRTLDTLMAQHFGETLPADDSAARAAAEADAVLRLRDPLRLALTAIDERDLFETLEMPLVAILRDMEAAGIAVDVRRLDEAGDKLAGMLADLRERVHTLAGEPFNLDSPKQVAQVLFEKLGLPSGRKTKSGWSTGAEVLEELAADHQIVALIVQYREYAKLKSTYVDSLLRLVSPADGRVHTTFEQTVAATGRLSSRSPNLQNIPVRTDWGREVRSCFVAQGAGQVLLAADYSQIELRILAHLSHDERLLTAFRAGQDIHAATAAAIFEVALDEVQPAMRRTAKTVNYAVLYGMGATALARQLGIRRPAAQEFIDHYFERLPGVRAYMDQVVARARHDGYVTTLFGRRRPIPELRTGNARARASAERAAANAPLQGAAADIIKRAMVRLAREMGALAPHCRMLLQVHDELVFELAQEDVTAVASLVREVMEGAGTLEVPLVVDLQVGTNWRDMQRLS